MPLGFEKLKSMKSLAELIRVFELSGASGGATGDSCTHGGQLELKVSDLGHCAVYEKELQRVWPITEENRRAKIAEFGERHGFRLAYYKQGHCAIFLDDPASSRQIAERAKPRDLIASPFPIKEKLKPFEQQIGERNQTEARAIL